MASLKRSIGKKLLVGIGLPGLLIAMGGLWVFYKRAERAVQDATRAEAMALAELLASSFDLAPGRTEPAVEAHRAVRETLRANWDVLRNVSHAQVVSPTGKIVWSRNTEEVGRQFQGNADSPAEAGRARVQFIDRRAEVAQTLGGLACAGCHIQGDAMKLGTLHLVVREPPLQDEVASVFVGALFGVLVFSLALGVVTAASLQIFLRRPIRKLLRVMAQAEEGDFLVRAEVKDDDEIGALSQAFNSMLARITSMKVDEIDTHRDLQAAHAELSLKKTLERRVNELQLLYDMGSSLTATLELPKLFSRIGTLIAERLQIPQFSIMLLGPENVLEVKSAYPKSPSVEGMTFKVGEGAAGRAAETLQPVYIRDIERDDPTYQRRATATGGPPKGCLLCIPMIHNRSLLGILNLERPEPNAFTDEEQELLRTVADIVAVAAKNALLHEETVALSLTDPLTGASNRRHLFSRLEREVERAQRFGTALSICLVDIDHFKQLNDTCGHRAGDEVLRKVSDLLRSQVRKLDTVARYGGEEFMILLPGVGMPEALEVAEKLRRSVAEFPFEHGPSQPLGLVSISVGVATLSREGDSQEALVDRADSALYAGKRAGRNKAIVYEPGMELHPGRERGPYAAKRRRTQEIPVAKLGSKS